MIGMFGIRAASRFSYKRMDTDATAFCTAAGISDRTLKAAANYYVRTLKFAAIWAKTVAFYPFLGGNASAHKFNLKNPVDSDTAFRIIFNGVWTHDANGGTPTPGMAYGDTRLNPSLALPLNQNSLGLYVHNFGNMQGSSQDMGSNNSAAQRLTLGAKTGSSVIFDAYNTTTGRAQGSNISPLGVFAVGSRVSSSSNSIYTGDMIATNLEPSAVVTAGTASSGGTNVPTANVILNGVDTGTLVLAARTYGFATVMTGLTAANAQNLYKTVWYVQFALRRML